MTPLADAPATLTKDELIKRLQEPLKAIASETLSSDDPERLAGINRARRNMLFWQGDQFVFPQWQDDGASADWAIYAGFSADGGNADGGNPSMAIPINMIRADGAKYAAVVSQRPPAIKAVPDDLADSNSVIASQQQEAVVRECFEREQVRDKQRQMARDQWLTGPTYVLTEYVTDGSKYGYSSEPTIETKEVRHRSGMTLTIPVPGKTKRFANGAVEIRLYNMLSVRHPHEAKSIDECHVLEFAEMHHKSVLLDIYGDKVREKDQANSSVSGSAATQQALQALADVESIRHTGRVQRKDYWLYVRRWYQARMYSLIEDKELRAAMQEQYPDGLHAAWVQGRLVDISNERASDKWSVCKSGLDDRILGDALAQDSMQFQRCLNDLVNLAVETVLRAIPRTVIDQSLIDREAMRDNAALPAEMIFTKNTPGRALSDLMGKLPTAEVSSQLAPLAQAIRQFTIDNNGMRPELYGGGQATQTFREALQRKNQALQQIEPFYAQTLLCWCSVASNLVKETAKYASGIIKPKSSGSIFDTEAAIVDLSNLPTTGVHMEAAEGFPMSYAEMVGVLQDLLGQTNPEVIQALGLTDPVNIPIVRELLLSIPGFKSPMEDGVKKAEWVIRQLLQEQPVEQVDPITGFPTGEMQPSLPPDDWDDHQFMADMLTKWMNSKRGINERMANPSGFDNVEARWRAEKLLAMPAQVPVEGGAPQDQGDSQGQEAQSAPESPLAEAPLPPINEVAQAA